ncbi:MAG TPA: PqqD family protein [Pyrinomonadaceae bacterium]|nr:PqqD family protein [Pyrinomonadaceae bacterium]
MNDLLKKPVARKEGLVIQEMPDEVLVFDLETNKAHCLNETAAFVWNACDGKKSVADITTLFGNRSGKPVDENLVWLAIDQLSESNLLEEELKANFNGQSRRDVIKKIGLAAVIALPIVSSLVAPTAVLAVTCSNNASSTTCGTAPNNICNSGTPCTCSDNNVGGPGSCNGTSTVCQRNGTNC